MKHKKMVLFNVLHKKLKTKNIKYSPCKNCLRKGKQPTCVGQPIVSYLKSLPFFKVSIKKILLAEAEISQLIRAPAGPFHLQTSVLNRQKIRLLAFPPVIISRKIR